MPALADSTTIVYPNVEVAADAILEDFVILGKPPRSIAECSRPTRIGSFAHVRSHTVIYAGCTIGASFQCGHHVSIREETDVGDDVSLGTGCVIEHHVVIEDGVRLHSNVFVPEFSILRKGCWIGPNAVLTNAKYPCSPDVKNRLVGPIIMPGAKVGANATLLPGVTIGRDSLVGAGSVVVRDVPERAVVVGNPGRIVKTVDELPY